MHMLPCPTCNRHFRLGESACPFCSAPSPSDARSRVVPSGRGLRLSRAAMLAFGTLATLPACGDDSDEDAEEGASTSANTGNVYGCPPQDDECFIGQGGTGNGGAGNGGSGGIGGGTGGAGGSGGAAGGSGGAGGATGGTGGT